MSDDAWKDATWSGARAAHQKDFMSLSFREKLLEIERLAEVARVFEERRRELGLPVREARGPTNALEDEGSA